MSATLTVAVVDDQDLFREGLSVLVRTQPDLQLVGCAASSARARSFAFSLRPNVMIIGVPLPVDDDVALADEVTALSPATRVLIATPSLAEPAVMRLLASSAAGFALKSQPVEEIFDAIRAVAQGDGYAPPEYAHLRRAARAARGS